ncbi:cystathionine gamma-synthase [Fluviispira multicolorata]|uniref:Cystathionine gamma-synthase n=1 Tax=Fluviispira multicolorata TaxID=2654512 RepID=A0A833JE84_9BACT|nr:cystathionine gamma-synthase [Fluviispira multicolorata]KAB8029704.1 cystathionine gamma-synthase [Fluviispira multicolorata]
MSSQLITNCVRSGIESDLQHGSVIPPLYLSANYAFEEIGKKREYDYTRSGNPTRNLLAETLSQLEGGKGAVVTSSGLSSVTLLLQLLRQGDLVVAPHDCYGGTWRLLNALSQKEQIKVIFVNQNNLEELKKVLELKPKQVWIETPSNPLLRIVDIEKVCELAHQVSAQVIVDNTFLSPILQSPLKLGADFVLHSTTKYLNGHSDVVGGCVIANSNKDFESLSWWANASGLTGAPFDSWLTLRGLRTLEVRIKRQQESAFKVAEFLSEQKKVKNVFYPGLSTHEGHHIAKNQQKGFGAMLSFELSGGICAVKNFVANLKCFSLAESLGGIESLVAHPATMTHASMTEEARKTAGIQDGLLRLSIGIEEKEDLLCDIKNALAQI